MFGEYVCSTNKGFHIVSAKREGSEYIYDIDEIVQIFGNLKSWRRWKSIGQIKYLNWYLSQINSIKL